MKSLLLEEFIPLAPDPANRNIREIYHSPFRPQHITAHFEGWEYDAAYDLFVDHTEDRNMVWFGAGTYFINGRELRWPPTLNDFIQDCRSLHIPLLWSEGTADKLWFTSPRQPGQPWQCLCAGHRVGTPADGEDNA
jgi:hypothetical protein